jgi:NAD-dependent SIR2 family protein deacetylase
MSIFVYRCSNNHVVEEMKHYTKMDEFPKCPECGEVCEKRLMGRPSISHNTNVILAGDDGFPPEGANYSREDKVWMI